MKINHRKGRVLFLWRRAHARNVRLYYPWRIGSKYTNLFIFRFVKKYNAYQHIWRHGRHLCNFQMCYEYFHSVKLLYSGYLSQTFWYKTNKRYIYIFFQFPPLSLSLILIRIGYSLQDWSYKISGKYRASLLINSKHYKTSLVVYLGGGACGRDLPPLGTSETDTLLKMGFETYTFCSKVPSKCRKYRFRDPNFKRFPGGMPQDSPRIVSSLWPPPH